MISTMILSFIKMHGRATTDQIEKALEPYGFNQKQILGGIGYLRKIRALKISPSIRINNRNQHIFY